MNKFQILKFDKRFKSLFRLVYGTSCVSIFDSHIIKFIDKYCFKTDAYTSGDIILIPCLGIKIMYNGKIVHYFDSNYNPVFYSDL